MAKYVIPQNLKFEKYHKKLTISSGKIETKVFNFHKTYQFGLVCLENTRLSVSQMEACFKIISKLAKKGKRVGADLIKSNFYPSYPVTSKSAGIRMGKGKGNVNFWVFPVKKGRLLFETKNILPRLAYFGLRQAQYRLPCLTKIVFRNPAVLKRLIGKKK
jgi:large subunit ribosomal protein L16